MTNLLKKLNLFLSRLETVLLVVLVIFLLVFAFLQVVLRNVFDSGINWADILNRSLVIWVGFFGATLSAGEDKHLSLEVLTKFLPDRLHNPIKIFVNAFTLVVCGILTHYAWLFFKDQITFEASDLLFAGFPKAYITVIFPLGFGLMSLRYTIKTILGLSEVLTSSEVSQTAKSSLNHVL